MYTWCALFLSLIFFALPIFGHTACVLSFSHLVEWEDRVDAMNYEFVLWHDGGITTVHAPLIRKDGTAKIVEREACTFFLRNGVLVGKGVILQNVFPHGTGSDGKRTITFQLLTIEVIAENEAGPVVLATYRVRFLSWLEELIAEAMGHKFYDYHKAVFGDDLGENVKIDAKSKELLRIFSELPRYC